MSQGGALLVRAVYLPTIGVIRRSGIIGPGRTEDLYLWVQEHHYYCRRSRATRYR